MAANGSNRPVLPAIAIGVDRRYSVIAAQDRVAAWIAAVAPVLGIGFVALATAWMGV